MATNDQVKALIRSHLEDEPERFITAALQVAAYEAQRGHVSLAREIRAMVDKAKLDRKKTKALAFPAELDAFVDAALPGVGLKALVLPASKMARLQKVISEYRNKD